MRLPRAPWLLGFSALALLGTAQAAGCGSGGSNTTHAAGTTGSGGTGATVSGSGGTGGGMAVCGDGKVEGMEQCDLGTANGTGMGCKSDCSFDCMADADCNAMMNACLGMATCASATAMGEMVKKCQAGTPLAQGAMCATGMYCVNMNCVAPSCGDGVVEAPEECDNGSMNGPGKGCESTCKFTCKTGDATRDCASTNACVANGTCDDATTHTCTPGGNVANGTACTGGTCQNGVCVVTSCTGAPLCAVCTTGLCSGNPEACNPSTCGDGCVDASKGEQCEPPNTATCDATCHFKGATCGNGTLEMGEQCDDGNTFDLDGCDSSCKYEVVTRFTAVAIASTAAPAALNCMPSTNRLGAQALTTTALSQLNPQLQTQVTSGAVNVMAQFLGLTDLTGVSDTGFSIGVLDAIPDPAKGAWPMAGNPEDWWFLADHSTVSMGLPTGLFMNANINNRNLTGGPNNVTLTLNLGGSPALLTLLNAHIAGTVNGNPAPNVPAPPPAQLAAGLTVFQTITANGAGQGLCGNITVASLAQIPVPQAIAMGGTTACSACPNSHAYTYCGMGQPVSATCNSLLDVIVGGCGVVPVFGNCLGTAVNPTQPDVPSGATVQQLTVGGTLNKVQQNVASDMDAYSAYLTFTANRAHFTGETCTQTSDCQTGKTCQAGVCK
jgi:cysteine-rich repeat protein